MIPVLLRDMLPRLLLVVLAGVLFFFLEPAFHPHDHGAVNGGVDEGPLGIAATLGNLASLAMLILLGDFISGDRRRGFARLYLSHPVDPLTLYGFRWGLALAAAMVAAALFLVIGQVVAWGAVTGGWGGLWLALVAALAWGGLVAGLSALLPRGDAWVAVGLYLLTFVWLEALALGAEPFGPTARQAITLLLPPMTALQDVYTGLLAGSVDGAASLFAAGYGAVWLLIAGLALRLREVG